MLDTNIVSDMVRNPSGDCFRHWARTRYAYICASAIVSSELLFGIEKRRSAKLSAGVEDFLSQLDVLPYEVGASRHYADIRNTLEKRGTPIGPVDLFIAAHARSLGLTLVTDNIREFSRVDGLKLENWLEREAPDAGN